MPPPLEWGCRRLRQRGTQAACRDPRDVRSDVEGGMATRVCIRATRCAQLLKLAVRCAEVQVDAAGGQDCRKGEDEKGFHQDDLVDRVIEGRQCKP